MADYQRLVNDVHEALSSDMDASPGKFAGLNTRLTDAIREVNERLSECDELLSKGHRAEAIRQAETEPNLLMAATALDSLDRDYWDACVAERGLPSPPLLAFEAAADLNEAYPVEQALARLMRNHRLRALARDSLRARISTMRRISRLDRDSPIWEDDIRGFEKVRLDQLEGEVNTAVQREDVSALALLEQEVRSQDWLEQPSERIIKNTVALHNRLRSALALRELEAIEAKLTQAYAEFDEDLGRELRTKWRSRAVLGVLQAGHPLLKRVAPALEWLEEMDEQARDEEEYREALANLEHALDEGCTKDELERLYHAVVRHETGLPEVIEQRVAERARALDVTAVRRGRRILVGGVILTLLAAGAVAFGIKLHLRKQEVAMIVMGGQELLDDGKLAECEGYVDKMETAKPYIKDSSEFQKLAQEVKAATEKERGRKERLSRYMEAARSAGIENPRWESFQTAFDELDEADKITASDGEKAEVMRLRGQVTNKRIELQDEVDETFTADLNQLLGRFENLDQEDMAAIDGLTNEAGALGERLRVTPELKSPLSPMVARLGAFREGLLATSREAQSLQAVTKSVGNQDGFRLALENYWTDFPGTSRAKSFEEVTKSELPLWNGVEQWNLLIGELSSQDWTSVSPGDAQTLLDKVEKVRADHEDCPQPANLESLLLYLESIANRVDADGNRSDAALREVFDHWSVSKVDMVETKDGKKYYFQKEPAGTFANTSFTFHYIPGFDETGTVRVKFDKKDIANPPNGESFDWTSPQTLFSKSALQQLAALNGGNWERTFCAILTELLGSQKMDPILKLQLLERVLVLAGEGSYPLKKAFEKHVELIESAGSADDALWPDPNDDAANDAREDAARTLARLGDIEAATSQTAQLLLEMSHPSFGASYAWIGWLHKNGSGGWTCSAQSGVLQGISGDLLVLHVQRGGGPAEFSKIGSIQAGRLAINASSEEVLVEGRGVFVAKTAGSSP